METNFIINTKEFSKMLAEIKRITPNSKKIDVKVSVYPYSLEFHFIGVVRTIKAETEGYCDFYIPFVLLTGISRTASGDTITLKVKDGQVLFKKSIICMDSIKLFSLFASKDIDLPVNPSSLDILNLRNRYTVQALKQLKVIEFLEYEEDKLSKVIYQVSSLLNPYGISTDDIKRFINNKIKEKLD